MTDRETIKNIAKLAKLQMDENEIDVVIDKLSNILNYAKKLDELDTENVCITHSPLNICNVFREDDIKESLSIEDALLNTIYKEGSYFKITK